MCALLSRVQEILASKIFRSDEPKPETSFSSIIANPFSIQIGSNYVLKNNNNIIYKSLFTKQKEYDVTAIGMFELINRVKVYRFYSGEGNSVAPGTSFLQLMVNKKTNEVEELRMFSLVEEVMPTRSLDWKIWVGEEGSNIGKFNIAVEERDFVRTEAWAQGNADWTPAFSFTEKVYESNENKVSATIKHEAMLYGRWLREEHNVAEFALLSSDDVSIADSNIYQDNRVAGICIFAGIDIAPQEVVVNY